RPGPATGHHDRPARNPGLPAERPGPSRTAAGRDLLPPRPRLPHPPGSPVVRERARLDAGRPCQAPPGTDHGFLAPTASTAPAPLPAGMDGHPPACPPARLVG